MLEIGSMVNGKYRVLREIGHGGMSVVYMAIDEKANKTWAIKEVRKDGVLDFEAVRQGLAVETEMLKRLRHPNLPSIVDVIEDDEILLIVMDYVEGNALSKELTEHGAQPQEKVVEWAKQLCDVLGYLHSRTPAIIYRDMKPSNIMLKPNGQIVLIDFGTAREYKDKNLADTTCLGTVGYAAPEQFGGMGQTDARTDIYGLGATLYHLLTGNNPSQPPYQIKPIRSINTSLSNGLEKIVEKCTQRDPDERYKSCAELMYDLEHYDEIDDQHKKRQRAKVMLFAVSLVVSLASLASGITTQALYVNQQNSTYDARMSDAAQEQRNLSERMDIYRECISMAGKQGEADPFLKMIELYEQYDSNGQPSDIYKFESSERNDMQSLIYSQSNELKARGNYAEVCYQMGVTTWLYYYGESGYCGSDNGSYDSMISSYTWFKECMDEIERTNMDFKNKNLAEIYYKLSKFAKDENSIGLDGSGAEAYSSIYTDLCSMVKKVNNQTPIMQLRVYDYATYLMYKRTANFQQAGKSERNLTDLCNQIEEAMDGITVASDAEQELYDRIMARYNTDGIMGLKETIHYQYNNGAELTEENTAGGNE
ncbi:MAG: serine/threonine protein kinase [Lachnospiraceae bacterium]|nr:serine/threonine protein kinase [Lachnospiraceae bacterium]